MSARFGAVGDRFIETESAIDAARSDIKSATSEIIAQNLQILNAVQGSLGVRT